MKTLVFVIMDIVGGQTTPLLLCPTRKMAEREFALFLSNTPLRPSDFVLYELGVFTKEDGVEREHPLIQAYEHGQYVCNGGEIEQEVAYYSKRTVGQEEGPERDGPTITCSE